MLTWLNLGLLLVSSPSSSVSISSTAIDCVAPEKEGSGRGPERGPESEKSEGGARSVRDFTSGFGVRSKLFVSLRVTLGVLIQKVTLFVALRFVIQKVTLFVALRCADSLKISQRVHLHSTQGRY